MGASSRPVVYRRAAVPVVDERASWMVYDAAYLALAEAPGARLLTLDVRLGRAAAPTVEVVALR